MNGVYVSLVTFISTLIGGLFAVRFKSKIHLIMGFTAGVLLGVVAFDILPQIIELIKENNFNTTSVMIALVTGFLLFHVLEKWVVIHHAHDGHYIEHKHPQVGIMQALALVGHSFMDGVGIALGFQINAVVGVLVAIAVVAHDFTDGMNTVSLMLSANNTASKAKIFLILDAVAPILGALSTLWFTVTAHFLVLYLGFFAGFLLYIGASDILPEAHSKESSARLIFLTILGVVFIFIVTRLI